MTDATKNTSAKGVAEIYKDGTYFENNKSWHVEDSSWKAEQIKAILSRNKIEPMSVCEVGCGAGEILVQLSRAMPATGFVGYEMSPQAFELCKTRESEKVEYRLENILEEDVSFDCLLCIDVFEHVEDYIGFVKSLRSKANHKIFHIPLDISVLSVLRGSMMSERTNVGHLHYFTTETALATLKESGYEIVDYCYTTSFSDLPSNSWKAGIAKFPRKFLYSISPDMMVRLLGGCSLLVLAK